MNDPSFVELLARLENTRARIEHGVDGRNDGYTLNLHELKIVISSMKCARAAALGIEWLLSRVLR